MRAKEIYETTNNRSVLKKAYKLMLARTKAICDRCPFHRGDNSGKRKGKRNWKRFRKTQWCCL